MLRFLMLLFVINLTQSCNSNKSSVANSGNDKIHNSLFQDAEKDYVFKSEIDIYGNSMSGIVIIKKLAQDKHRLVFTTDFGNKLIDLQFENGQITVNSAVEEWNRKRLLKVLKQDFSVLFQENFTGNRVGEELKSMDNKTNHILKIQLDESQITSLERNKKQRISLTNINYSSSKEIENIEIQHFDIPLRIILFALKN